MQISGTLLKQWYEVKFQALISKQSISEGPHSAWSRSAWIAGRFLVVFHLCCGKWFRGGDLNALLKEVSSVLGSWCGLLLDQWINDFLLFFCRLSTFGNAGSSHLDYPKDSDLMESFNCNETQVNRSVLVMKRW